MAEYAVALAPTAKKALALLSRQDGVRIVKAMMGLRTDPRPHGYRKLVGATRYFRIRVGSYRVVYEIDDVERTVIVADLGPQG